MTRFWWCAFCRAPERTPVTGGCVFDVFARGRCSPGRHSVAVLNGRAQAPGLRQPELVSCKTRRWRHSVAILNGRAQAPGLRQPEFSGCKTGDWRLSAKNLSQRSRRHCRYLFESSRLNEHTNRDRQPRVVPNPSRIVDLNTKRDAFRTVGHGICSTYAAKACGASVAEMRASVAEMFPPETTLNRERKHVKR